MSKEHSEDEDALANRSEWNNRKTKRNNTRTRELTTDNTNDRDERAESSTNEEYNAGRKEQEEMERPRVKDTMTHRYRYKKLKFLIIWEGYEDLGHKWVSEKEMTEHNPTQLAEYLWKLHVKHPRSFNALMRKHAHLMKAIKKENS